MATQIYTDQLSEEIRDVPDEYMPALINMVHAFRLGVVQKSLEESLARSWDQTQSGNTYPIETLWDDMDSTSD